MYSPFKRSSLITSNITSAAEPAAYETVNSAGVSKKRYPSRSTNNKLRQSVINKALASLEVSYMVDPNSPPPSSPLSLSSLQSYTSEDDFDDNFIGEEFSEDEREDTISSDGDFEPEAKDYSAVTSTPVTPQSSDLHELLELCTTDLEIQQNAPKIVLCQETPEGTRTFDSREVVGAAALTSGASITFKPFVSLHAIVSSPSSASFF